MGTRDAGDEQLEQHIRQQRLAGSRSGVNGTPTFFINGRRHGGENTAEGLGEAARQASR